MDTLSEQMKRPSMTDVARTAGVSKTTVSYVLNNNPKVTDETKTRVLRVCEQLGYRVNKNIQDLVRSTLSQTTRNIAFVLVEGDISNPVLTRYIDGVARGAEENNYHLLFARLSGEESSIMDLPPILRDNRVDGMLLIGNLNPVRMNVLRSLEIPFVILGNYGHDVTNGSFVVECDIGAGVHGVISNILKLGRRKIAFFNESMQSYGDRRYLLSYKEALITHGIEIDESIIYMGEGHLKGALSTMTSVFQKKELPFDTLYCPDFRCCNEISHLVMSRSWVSPGSDVLLATSKIHDSIKLAVPTVYMDGNSEEVAYQGFIMLLDGISGKKQLCPGTLRLLPSVVWSDR